MTDSGRQVDRQAGRWTDLLRVEKHNMSYTHTAHTNEQDEILTLILTGSVIKSNLL